MSGQSNDPRKGQAGAVPAKKKGGGEPPVITLPAAAHKPPLKKAEENLRRFFRGTMEYPPAAECGGYIGTELERVLDNIQLDSLESVLHMALYEAEHVGHIYDHMQLLQPMYELVAKVRDLQQSLLYETARRLNEEPMDAQDYAANPNAVKDFFSYLTKPGFVDNSKLLQRDLLNDDLMTLDDTLVQSLSYALMKVQFNMPNEHSCDPDHRIHCDVTNDLIKLLRDYRTARIRDAMKARFVAPRTATN
jgi:hypothetical protein